MDYKNIKEFLAFFISLHMNVEKAREDGKIDMMDAALLFEPLRKAVPAFTDMNKMGAEAKDLSVGERAELIEWLKGEYDLADDKLEDIVEKAMGLIIHVAAFAMMFKK